MSIVFRPKSTKPTHLCSKHHSTKKNPLARPLFQTNREMCFSTVDIDQCDEEHRNFDFGSVDDVRYELGEGGVFGQVGTRRGRTSHGKVDCVNGALNNIFCKHNIRGGTQDEKARGRTNELPVDGKLEHLEHYWGVVRGVDERGRVDRGGGGGGCHGTVKEVRTGGRSNI
jgi:hypothetical protein